MGKIRLIGSRNFIDRTKECLLLLREKDFMSYKVVIQNLGAIVENKVDIGLSYFDPFKEVPTAFMTKVCCEYDLKWYAAALVHEAYHGKLFSDAMRDGKNPSREYCGYSAEMYCLTKQIECLKKIGARENDILYAIEHYDKKWWKDSSDEFNLIDCLNKINLEKKYGDNWR